MTRFSRDRIDDRKQSRGLEALERLSKIYPDPKTELKNWETEFQFLVCILLSSQTTDTQVNKVTSGLFKNYPDALSFSYAKVEDVEAYISSINYYKTKSRHIIGMSKILVEKFNSEIPKKVSKLIELPGVGRKTANVFLNEMYKSNQGIPVDTHVARLSRRLDLSNEYDPNKIAKDLEKIYSRDHWYKVNSTFVLYGRYYCKAKKPLCKNCAVKEFCIEDQL